MGGWLLPAGLAIPRSGTPVSSIGLPPLWDLCRRFCCGAPGDGASLLKTWRGAHHFFPLISRGNRDGEVRKGCIFEALGAGIFPRGTHSDHLKNSGAPPNFYASPFSAMPLLFSTLPLPQPALHRPPLSLSLSPCHAIHSPLAFHGFCVNKT
jgi:hypothetical protein